MRSRLKKQSVLIVDSDTDLRNTIVEYLSMQSDICVAGSVGDGIEALTAVRQCRPDVIVIDSMLPLLDGLGLFRHIRSLSHSKGNEPACIFLVCDGQDVLLQEMISQGANYCMVKPVDLAELTYRIRHAARDACSNELYRKLAAHTLRAMKMRIHDDGFEYAQRAVAILLEERNRAVRYKSVYIRVEEETAEFCADGGKYVENDIRNAIKRTHAVFSPFYCEVMGFGPGESEKCPSNGVFLASVVQYIRNHHNLT